MGAIFTDSRRISETQRFNIARVRNPRILASFYTQFTSSGHWGRGFVAFLVSLVAFYKKLTYHDYLYKKNYRIETGKIFILKYAREAAGGRFSVYKRFYD